MEEKDGTWKYGGFIDSIIVSAVDVGYNAAVVPALTMSIQPSCLMIR